MAFDTANKRYAALGFGLDFMRVRPEPDGTVDTTDRMHFLPLFINIALGELVGGDGEGRRRMRVGRAIWNHWKLLYKRGA